MRGKQHLMLAPAVFCLLFFACAPKKKNPKLSLAVIQAERYFEYGLSKLQQGKPKEAENFFRKAVKLDPLQVVFYQGVGRALQKQNKSEQAAEVLLEGANINSTLPILFFQLGDVYVDCNSWANVIKYSLFALEFKKFELRAAALSNLGSAYMGLKFWEPARYTLEAALMEDPDYVPARWQLILTLEELQEWTEIIRNGRKILRFGEKHQHQLTDFFLSQVNEQIALAYSKLGKAYVGETFKKKAQLLAPGRNISLEK